MSCCNLQHVDWGSVRVREQLRISGQLRNSGQTWGTHHRKTLESTYELTYMFRKSIEQEKNLHTSLARILHRTWVCWIVSVASNLVCILIVSSLLLVKMNYHCDACGRMFSLMLLTSSLFFMIRLSLLFHAHYWTSSLIMKYSEIEQSMRLQKLQDWKPCQCYGKTIQHN